MSVFDEMFEVVEHRLCLRHLYANFKKKFGGGTIIRDLMMGQPRQLISKLGKKNATVEGN